jgi:cysteine desulfurase family protein
LDNGATSYPKAPGVADAMCRYIEQIGSNVSRGSTHEAFETQRVLLETREKMAHLLHFDDATHVVFTKNITESLNILLKGLLTSGDHVIISPLEHNAVMRPLKALEKQGVSISKASCDHEGNLDIASITPLIKPHTKAIVMTHASNVCGTVLDLVSVGKIAKVHNLYFIIDAAQTVGILDVDFKRLQADALAFTGHKALLGPQGTGGFLITKELAQLISPLILGGTGSASDSEEQPEYMPDKFESGTPNTVGLFGLHAALTFIEKEGLEALGTLEMKHTKRFLEALEEIPTLRIVGRSDLEARTAVVSLDFLKHDNADICWRLDQEFGIATRVGMHCAPSAHHALYTYPQGTVRFSFSPFTTDEEIETAINAVIALAI